MTSDKKRICLIDGSGYIYRAFYALPPMTRPSDKTPINAVFGFTSMLMNFVKENADDCIAVVFDTERHNFRNEIFPAYKATRKEVPEDLIPQFPLIREVVKAFDIAGVEEEGYEADDLIASYTRQALSLGYEVVVVSADKDLTQLMNGENVRVFDPMKKRFVTEEDVIAKFGVLPDKVTQVQALMGDATDNIPGIKGIGPKTAGELIASYGSLDNLYQHLDEITGRKHDLLAQGKADAYMSLKLVTLAQNAPLPKPIDDFCSFEPDTVKIKAFLENMGFKTLMGRVGDFVQKRCAVLHTNTPIESKKIERHYECVQDEAVLLKWCEKIKNAGFVAFDTETDSLDSQSAQIAGISLCVEAGYACYIPLNHGEEVKKTAELNLFETLDSARPLQLSKGQIKKHLLPVLQDKAIMKIGHNIKFDLEVIHTNFDVDLSDDNLQDTIVMSYDLDGVAHSNSLDELALIFLDEKMISYRDVCGTGKGAIYFKQVPLDKATAYAAEDADMTLRLFYKLKERLAADESLKKVYNDIDRPLIPVLTQMENQGVQINKTFLQQLSFRFYDKIVHLEKEIFALAGERFNINSPVQLGEILFDKMGIAGGKRNSKSKNWSTESDILEEVAANGIEIAAKILEYRQYNKLKSTYTDALVNLVNPRTNRVHTTFSQTMTTTGRLSSNNPNLQNIPVRTEEGREIRAAFIADKGHSLLSADYSQVELRLLAAVADVKQLRADFAAGLDIHAATASQIFGVPVEGMDPMVRRRAKAINFGIVYGISAFGLARQLGISRTEAKQYIDAYFEKYSEIKKYMDDTIQFASEHNYVLTPFGRKCYVAGFENQSTRGFASRAAINAPIQGGAADIIKMAMIKMQNELKKRALKTKMLLQVHDELVFDVPDEELEIVRPLVRDVMENIVKLPVPLLVEIGVGKNWKEAH